MQNCLHTKTSIFVVGLFTLASLYLHSCDSANHYAFEEIEVEYHNLHDEVRLTGTLTLPETEHRVPAALLIQGSGPHDRNEEIWGHPVFEVIAHHLAQRGIAVLRADKRGTGQSGGTFVFFDIESFVEDAFAGVHFLQNHQRVDARRVGLVGHSLGGLIAPIMASQSEEIAYIALMAGPGVWGKKAFYHQNKLWAEISGVPQRELSKIEELCDRLFEILMREEALPEDKGEFYNIYVTLSMYLDQELRETFYPGPPDKGFLVFRTPQFRKAFLYDPGEILQRVRCPVLAMHGSLDIHVDARENLRAIEDALQKGNNRSYKILELENHNHLFQRCRTGRPSECSRIRESISPIALKSISDWILAITQKHGD